MFRDINQDGLADIYVCNDFAEPDRIWLNQGQGFSSHAEAVSASCCALLYGD